MHPFEKPVMGGAAFKPGRIGDCEICRQRAEVGQYEDGRMICGDCYDAMAHGKKQKGLPPPVVTPAPTHDVQLYTNWNASEPDERERYLNIIRTASSEIKRNVIKRLVEDGVFEHDFHKIIQNERWFSVLGLRQIALLVDPNFENPPLVQHEKVTAKRSPKCQKIKTPKRRQQLKSPQLPKLPRLPQEEAHLAPALSQIPS